MDTAKGLAYLHANLRTKPAVCHGDIKAVRSHAASDCRELIRLPGEHHHRRRCKRPLVRLWLGQIIGRCSERTDNIEHDHLQPSIRCTRTYLGRAVVAHFGERHMGLGVPPVGGEGMIARHGPTVMTRCQILTGIQPYEAKKRDVTITKAIIRGELPAEISSIGAPRFVRDILQRCWQPDLKSRPSIEWCQSALSVKATPSSGKTQLGEILGHCTSYEGQTTPDNTETYKAPDSELLLSSSHISPVKRYVSLLRAFPDRRSPMALLYAKLCPTARYQVRKPPPHCVVCTQGCSSEFGTWLYLPLDYHGQIIDPKYQQPRHATCSWRTTGQTSYVRGLQSYFRDSKSQRDAKSASPQSLSDYLRLYLRLLRLRRAWDRLPSGDR